MHLKLLFLYCHLFFLFFFFFHRRYFGTATLTAVKKFQKDNGLVVDGIVGAITQDKLAQVLKAKEDTSMTNYYTIDGLHVIETTPDNIYIWRLGNTLRGFGVYGINGTWQDNNNAHNPESIWSIACNGGKIIGPNAYQNSPKGYKRGTIIYYKDGSIEITRINNVNEIKKPYEWAIGGGMLLPSYDPESEGYIDKSKDVLRKTAHTGIGYKDGKVYLFTKENLSMKEFLDSIRLLGLIGAIFLDGGGSTQLNYKGKGIHSTRILSHGVFIKKP